MILTNLASAIVILFRLFELVVLAYVLTGYFLDSFNPIRRTLDNLVQPFLDPIRRFLPMSGPVDFSPWILLILLELISRGLL